MYLFYTVKLEFRAGRMKHNVQSKDLRRRFNNTAFSWITPLVTSLNGDVGWPEQFSPNKETLSLPFRASKVLSPRNVLRRAPQRTKRQMFMS